jgi:lysophospholipase L1-like esterase
MAGGATLAAAAPSAAPGEGAFLALGDSVVFGFIEQDGYAYVNPDNFVGYPEIVGRTLGLNTANASCPGETTDGFMSTGGADNGCRPFRHNFPLHIGHVADTATQLGFATNFLTTHERTRLVTISLGANDAFLLQTACIASPNPNCIQDGLPVVLSRIYANMNTILGNLRATGYRGVLMVVNYYSLDYNDQLQTGFSMAINQVLAAAAAANGAVVADAFAAFQTAATPAGGKTCMAGLLNGGSPNQWACDVHPSLSGQRLLAKTVESAYQAARRGD